jgi:hypothetical protein
MGFSRKFFEVLYMVGEALGYGLYQNKGFAWVWFW